MGELQALFTNVDVLLPGVTPEVTLNITLDNVSDGVREEVTNMLIDHDSFLWDSHERELEDSYPMMNSLLKNHFSNFAIRYAFIGVVDD